MGNTDARVAALRRRVSRERNAATGRVRYSDELRGEVVSLVKDTGISRTRVAARLGLSQTGLHRWMQKANSRGVQHRGARLRQVEIVQEPRSSELTLEFPSGARVRGLGIAELRILLGVEG